MSRQEDEIAAIERYKKIYPERGDAAVIDFVEGYYNGKLAIISATVNGAASEEIAFYSHDGALRTFDSTKELAYFLGQKSNESFFTRLFTTPVLSGVVFLLVLIAMFIVGFFSSFNKDIISILGSVVGVAAGFFFGANKPTTR